MPPRGAHRRHVIDRNTAMRWATETARGMSYLHSRSPPIVHRDLKSGNLLVDEDWHIKVSDFGLAQTKITTHAHTQARALPPAAAAVLRRAPPPHRLTLKRRRPRPLARRFVAARAEAGSLVGTR